MFLIKTVFNQDFLLFFVGVYGPQVAKFTQLSIAKCDTDVFTFLFLFGIYIFIHFEDHKIK